MHKEINASDFHPYDIIRLNTVYGDADSYTIIGDIPEGTIIQAPRGDLEVQGRLLHHSSIEMNGILDVRGIMQDHITLNAGSITAFKVGKYANFSTTNGDLFVPYIGDYAQMKALGSLHFDTGGDGMQGSATKDIRFSRLGNDATLLGNLIKGRTAGERAHLTATEYKVVLDTVGDDSTIVSASGHEITQPGKNIQFLQYEPSPGEHPKASMNSTLSPEGCRIFRDFTHKRYVIDDANWTKYGAEVMSHLMGQLIHLDCTITKGIAIAPNGTSFDSHFVAFPESKANYEKVRMLISRFVDRHKVRGEAD